MSDEKHLKKVGNYVLGRTIGEGCFSKVKLGTHLVTNEKVAVKVVEKAKLTDQSDITRLTREIQILKLLSHPNVVHLFELIDTPRHLYIVQEYLPNGELFDYIVARKRLTEQQTANFFVQILLGVDYLHQHNVSHRDLKPENCVLDADNRIKIIDFGLSNVFQAYAQLKTACGSPAYACPEMIKGESYNGAMADTWSCGIILFAMLTGCLPFEGDDVQAMYTRILSGFIKFPDYVSIGARDCVKKLLTVDWKKRSSIAEVLKDKWLNDEFEKANPKKHIELNPGKRTKQLSFRVLTQMKELGCDIQQTVVALKANKFNSLTSTYAILFLQIEEGKLVLPQMPTEPLVITDRIQAAKDLGFAMDGSAMLVNEKPVMAICDDLDPTQRPDERVELTEKDNLSQTQVHSEGKPPTDTPNPRLGELPPTPNPVNTRHMDAPGDRRSSTPRQEMRTPRELTPVDKTRAPKESSSDVDGDGLRPHAGPLTTGTATRMTAAELLPKVEQALTFLRLKFVREMAGLYKAQRLGCMLSVEVCRAGEMRCIVMRRMSGDAWVYKEMCT